MVMTRPSQKSRQLKHKNDFTLGGAVRRGGNFQWTPSSLTQREPFVAFVGTCQRGTAPGSWQALLSSEHFKEHR